MYKTITLGGAEQEIRITGQNCDVRNDGAETIYISAKPDIVAGADGVLSVPIGQAAKLLDCRGTVYLLGTGIVQLCGNDYSELVFKCAPAGGGGDMQDDVARGMASANAKSITTLQSDVKSVQAASSANTESITTLQNMVVNSNLLVNGGLMINQRGRLDYANEVGPDKWVIGLVANFGYEDEKPVFTVKSSPTSASALCRQDIKGIEGRKIAGNIVTLSIDATPSSDNFILRLYAYTADGSVTKRNRSIELRNDTKPWTITTDIPADAPWLRVTLATAAGTPIGDILTIGDGVKLEFGGRNTKIIPAPYGEELARCQRYYQIRSTGDVDPVDLRPAMGNITDIVEREDGNYGYIATD